MAYNATQNTITETAPAPNSAPTMNPMQPQPGGTAPHNPYAGRRGRRQIANPFGPPDAQSMGAGAGAPPQPGGVQGGPNPMAMNQWGMAPQAATGGNPMSSVVATPNAPITSTVPGGGPSGGGAQNGVYTPPPSGSQQRDWVLPYRVDSANAASRIARVNPGIGNGDPLQNPNFKQWQNLLPRADAASASVAPYQETALNRLGSMYGNPTIPTLNPFTSLDPNAPARGAQPITGLADSAAQQVAGALPQSYATLQFGQDLRGQLDQGRAADYGFALDRSVNDLTNSPDLSTLAKAQFDAQNRSSDLGLDRQLRQIREQQAADGRLGISVDNQQNDLLARTAADRGAESARLAMQAAQGTQQGNLARASTLGDLYGQQTGTGLAAYGLGRGIAGDNTSQSLGSLGALGTYANQTFGRGQTGFQNAAQQQGAGIDFNQQGVQNQLALNAQQYQQMLDLARFGDPNRVLDPYTTMAGIEAGATNINLGNRNNG